MENVTCVIKKNKKFFETSNTSERWSDQIFIDPVNNSDPLEIIKEKILDGENLGNVVREHVRTLHQLKYAESLAKYSPNKMRKVKVYWFWGPAGSGKTHTAFDMFPNAWISGGDLRRWIGYAGHTEVIIENLGPASLCRFPDLLRILDKYPYTVETKGGSIPLEAKNIVITSLFRPEQICRPEDVDRLFLRIHEIREFGNTVKIDKN
jgi:hypothetical protein